MKAILLSIKPEWVCKILNGEKTIEIRKTMPKCELPIDVYIYCTNDRNHLVAPFNIINGIKYKLFVKIPEYMNKAFNGKVVAKFTMNCEKMFLKEIIHSLNEFSVFCNHIGLNYCADKNLDIIKKYAAKKDYIYAWHIDNLVIFDKPKELYDYTVWNYCVKCEWWHQDRKQCGYDNNCIKQCLTKAPQSWCYVEVKE